MSKSHCIDKPSKGRFLQKARMRVCTSFVPLKCYPHFSHVNRPKKTHLDHYWSRLNTRHHLRSWCPRKTRTETRGWSCKVGTRLKSSKKSLKDSCSLYHQSSFKEGMTKDMDSIHVYWAFKSCTPQHKWTQAGTWGFPLLCRLTAQLVSIYYSYPKQVSLCPDFFTI